MITHSAGLFSSGDAQLLKKLVDDHYAQPARPVIIASDDELPAITPPATVVALRKLPIAILRGLAGRHNVASEGSGHDLAKRIAAALKASGVKPQSARRAQPKVDDRDLTILPKGRARLNRFPVWLLRQRAKELGLLHTRMTGTFSVVVFTQSSTTPRRCPPTGCRSLAASARRQPPTTPLRLVAVKLL